ncbi:hypothetical protein M514_07443 [Trichuris suis]|uniref:Uncharacterized protein n=1 Tax=Trichuris suis TaxID=68888 RepID=A0A085NCD8_9BILA|nr:hypothetical protein M513_07443 [Trichuris suis]KFD67134.1 hypothetical protein M514_07443 [Trichuris suis]KHJ41459.1 GPR1/FUN34/YaaH family protein [Trichuris suis]
MALKPENVPLQPKRTLEDIKHAVVTMKNQDEAEYIKFKNFLHGIDPTLRSPIKKLSNPAALGLGGFGAAVFMLQLKNMGLVSPGPTLWMALVLGGLLQLFAGLQEFRTGNNFGYTAFSCFGGVWLCFGLIPLGEHAKLYKFVAPDMGAILIIFTLFTFVFLYPAANIDLALFLMFFDLFVAFVVADVAHFMDHEAGRPVETASAVIFIIGGVLAWYNMAHIIYLDVFQRDVLPVGPAPLKKLFGRRYIVNDHFEHA